MNVRRVGDEEQVRRAVETDRVDGAVTADLGLPLAPLHVEHRRLGTGHQDGRVCAVVSRCLTRVKLKVSLSRTFVWHPRDRVYFRNRKFAGQIVQIDKRGRVSSGVNEPVPRPAGHSSQVFTEPSYCGDFLRKVDFLARCAVFPNFNLVRESDPSSQTFTLLRVI